MSVEAGYNTLVTTATGLNATYTQWNGAKSAKIGDSRTDLDTTDFADGNIHARILGLRDIKIDITGDLEAADVGYKNALAAYTNGTNIMCQVYLSAVAPTVGFLFVCNVGNVDLSSTVDGKVEFSSTLMIDATAGTPVSAFQ